MKIIIFILILPLVTLANDPADILNGSWFINKELSLLNIEKNEEYYGITLKEAEDDLESITMMPYVFGGNTFSHGGNTSSYLIEKSGNTSIDIALNISINHTEYLTFIFHPELNMAMFLWGSHKSSRWYLYEKK